MKKNKVFVVNGGETTHNYDCNTSLNSNPPVDEYELFIFCPYCDEKNSCVYRDPLPFELSLDCKNCEEKIEVYKKNEIPDANQRPGLNYLLDRLDEVHKKRVVRISASQSSISRDEFQKIRVWYMLGNLSYLLFGVSPVLAGIVFIYLSLNGFFLIGFLSIFAVVILFGGVFIYFERKFISLVSSAVPEESSNLVFVIQESRDMRRKFIKRLGKSTVET